jgi:hypothetical protein
MVTGHHSPDPEDRRSLGRFRKSAIPVLVVLLLVGVLALAGVYFWQTQEGIDPERFATGTGGPTDHTVVTPPATPADPDAQPRIPFEAPGPETPGDTTTGAADAPPRQQ